MTRMMSVPTKRTIEGTRAYLECDAKYDQNDYAAFSNVAPQIISANPDAVLGVLKKSWILVPFAFHNTNKADHEILDDANVKLGKNYKGRPSSSQHCPYIFHAALLFMPTTYIKNFSAEELSFLSKVIKHVKAKNLPNPDPNGKTSKQRLEELRTQIQTQTNPAEKHRLNIDFQRVTIISAVAGLWEDSIKAIDKWDKELDKILTKEKTKEEPMQDSEKLLCRAAISAKTGITRNFITPELLQEMHKTMPNAFVAVTAKKSGKERLLLKIEYIDEFKTNYVKLTNHRLRPRKVSKVTQSETKQDLVQVKATLTYAETLQALVQKAESISAQEQTLLSKVQDAHGKDRTDILTQLQQIGDDKDKIQQTTNDLKDTIAKFEKLQKNLQNQIESVNSILSK